MENFKLENKNITITFNVKSTKEMLQVWEKSKKLTLEQMLDDETITESKPLPEAEQAKLLGLDDVKEEVKQEPAKPTMAEIAKRNNEEDNQPYIITFIDNGSNNTSKIKHYKQGYPAFENGNKDLTRLQLSNKYTYVPNQVPKIIEIKEYKVLKKDLNEFLMICKTLSPQVEFFVKKQGSKDKFIRNMHLYDFEGGI